MRRTFELSLETSKIIGFFAKMKLNEVASFEDVSKAVGFKVTSSTPAYHSARRIIQREKAYVIEGVRGYGFQRLNGSDIGKRGVKQLRRIARAAYRGAKEQEIALTFNMDRNDQLLVTQNLTRFRLVSDVARTPSSNKVTVEEPEVVASSIPKRQQPRASAFQ